MPSGAMLQRTPLKPMAIPFDPTAITGYFAEYDADIEAYTADDFATLASIDGDAVGGWKDQNANQNPVSQATSGKRPVWHTGGPNGHAYVQSDGTADRLFSASIAGSWTTPATIYLVMRTDTWASFRCIFGSMGNDVGLVLYDGSPELCAQAGNTAMQNGGLSVGTWGIVTAKFIRNSVLGSGTGAHCRVNKGTTIENTDGSSQWAPSELFNIFGSTTYTFGGSDNHWSAVSISRILVYCANHNTTVQDVVVDGLASQYAISV
jgi:hypothetical protein